MEAIKQSAETTVGHRGLPTLTGRRAMALVTLWALGVVYGDIGTSPLYAMKECLAFPTSPHAIVSTAATLHSNVLGVLSLIFWALFLIIQRTVS